ncbi:GDSL-type esterase/lipase family protein [Utexia brackfieldae]|uniref:GDSL-type esterase/lipase family protein n=1 Tax=Utexia brackfieldae TaxID=3074108 RepID=UPI00370D60AF
MSRIMLLWAIWLMSLWLSSSGFAQTTELELAPKMYTGIVDFGDPNVAKLSARFSKLEHHSVENDVVVITQFGDSHSAADFFTGELRRLMQERYGDAGIGWVTPMPVPGQYHIGLSWKTQHWQIVSSRNVHDRLYPMGGYIASPTKNSSVLQVIPQQSQAAEKWTVSMRVKLLKRNALQVFDAKETRLPLRLPTRLNQWQSVNFVTTMPFQIKTTNMGVELGSFWLQKRHQAGVIVSPIATNGAKLSLWQKWSADWFDELPSTKSDLVILAYGTNESFESTLNLAEYRKNLIYNIAQIRKQLPRAVILLFSSPDTLLSSVSAPASCDARHPPSYQAVRQIQQEVAQSERLLYWDWQTAMGGNCIIEKWRMMDLARPDLVHLTRTGYVQSATTFYQDLLKLLR